MTLRNLYSKYKEIFILGFVLGISLVFHGYNMFNYPYFENDEATYLAQAWSFLSEGKLAPYTYWYDHAPVGWLFSSVWILLTGGLFTFGFSLNSARIFMLVIHLASTFFLYRITKRITGTDLSAFITSLFFVISPLAIYFQRRFLLDNLMTFWILLSLYLILYARNRLISYFASAIAFGIAVLTKENAIFFMPIFVGLVISSVHKSHRIVVIAKWIIVTGMIISLYPLYALLKNELFPPGSFFSPPGEHVSLLGTLLFQSSRGANLPFWDTGSDFIVNMKYWFSRDGMFMTLGVIGFFAVMFQAAFNKASRIVFFLTLSILAFLASGKLVINFYVVPLIPFFAMCIGYIVDQQLKFFKGINRYLYVSLLLIFLGVVLQFYFNSNNLRIALFTDETTNQVKAIEWTKRNIEKNKFIAIDYYGNLDLVSSRYIGDPKFTNADWFWKVQFDPEIKEDKLQSNSANIDYIMLTAEMYRSIIGIPNNESLILKALRNSSLVYFSSDDSVSEFELSTYPKSHPNGNWVAIFKQNTLDENLSSSWELYKEKFILDSGMIVSPSSSISGKDQSIALMRAVMAQDKDAFDSIYSWTKRNLLLKDKKLFATSIDVEDELSRNFGTTTLTDQEIAFALLLAYREWNSEEYLTEAKAIIADIWKHETVTISGKRYIVAGDWTAGNLSRYTINPSYYSPLTYKLFSEYDRDNNWLQIVDTSYDMLIRCTTSSLQVKNAINLPPTWCDISNKGVVAESVKMGKRSADYSQDTSRLFLSLGLDYAATKDVRAQSYMKSVRFFSDEWSKNKRISNAYTHSGQPLSKDESLSHYAALLAMFAVSDKSVADQMYADKILSQASVNKDGYYWGNKDSNIEQYFAWLGVNLYFNRIPGSLVQINLADDAE